jgi:hypothetical protein
MSNNIVIGIDPGAKGALAVLVDGFLDLYDLKDCYADTGSFRSLDPVLFNALLGRVIPHWYIPAVVTIYCEESQVMGGCGIKASSKSIRSVYDSRGVMRSVFCPRAWKINYVQPQNWKRYFGLLKQDKAASVDEACKLFPAYTNLFTKQWRGKTVLLDGRAEASLIAYYGNLILKGEICNGKKKKRNR